MKAGRARVSMRVDLLALSGGAGGEEGWTAERVRGIATLARPYNPGMVWVTVPCWWAQAGS